MTRKTVGMQIKVTEDVRKRAKVVAKKQGFSSVSELVLTLLANAGDAELKNIVKRDLEERPKRGRPWDK